MSKFKEINSFDKRKLESTKICTKYPDRIPIICERGGKSDMPEIDKSKYLVPADLTLGQFVYIIRKRIELTSEKAIFLFTENNVIPPTSSLISDIYDKYKNEDEFLYLIYAGENTFG